MKTTLHSFGLTALLMLFCQSLFAYDFWDNKIHYTITSETDSTVCVCGISDYFYGDLTIPNSVSYYDISYHVTSIGAHAFLSRRGLTSINIPNSVTTIGYDAFSGCSGLTDINFPNSLTSIGDCAFHGCTGLTDINFPNSLTSIGNRAFPYCI